MSSLLNYKWTDSPNNQDCLKKSIFLAKYSAKYGFLVAVADIICRPVGAPPRTHLQNAARLGVWMIPAVGATTAFTVTQQVTSRLYPNLDQKFAFMFGAWAAGGVIGAAARCGETAFMTALFGGGAMFAYQYMREAQEELKGTKLAEPMTIMPKDMPEIAYERHQPSHWLFNDYDYRYYTKKERGGVVHPIG